MDKKFFLLNVLGIFVGIAIGVILFLLLFTGCAAVPVNASGPQDAPIDETKDHVHYAPQFEENNNRLWAGSPVFADGTTSRACFNTPIESYFIYDPQVGTWMAMVCQLADGYGIVYSAPNAPFSIEKVTEYDLYLRGKGYIR
jgi:hypothetical protein